MARWPGAETIVRQALAKFLDLEGQTDYYVACFCTEGNLLNQWRIYGAAGGGYSIGFKTDGLVAAIGHSEWLLPVVYDRAVAKGLIVEACDRAYDVWRRWDALPEGGAVSPTSNCVACLAAELLIWRNVLKHEDFRPESEFRIIVQVPRWRSVPPENTPALHFRTKHGIAVPFVEFKLSNQPTESPVTSVRVGPTSERVCH